MSCDSTPNANRISPAAANVFSGEVEKVLALLARLPRLGRVVGDPYRRIKLGRFPHSIIYVLEGNRVIVHTIVSNYESLDSTLRRLRAGPS